MLFGIGALGTLPFLGTLDDFSEADPYILLRSLQGQQLKYIVELAPYDSSVETEEFSIPGPINACAINDYEYTVFGALVTWYFSDHQFITEPTDNPANQYFAPAIDNALQFDISIARGNDFSVSVPSYGSIEIHNEGGEYDDLLDLQLRGRGIVVKAGGEGYSYEEYVPVFNGVIRTTDSNDSKINLTISDKGFLFDKEILSDSYAGTGGLEGGSDIAGSMKPLAYGECYNVEPVLVDPVNLVYQIHNGSMEAVSAVYDAGVALTFDEDVADITTANPGDGEYATSLTTGFIKLGSTPAGRITCNIEGDNDDGYVAKTGELCLKLVQTLYGSESLNITEIDEASFTQLDTDLDGNTGLYLNQRITLRRILDALLTPLASFWYFDVSGNLVVASADQETTDIEEIDEDVIDQDGVEMVGIIPPSWRIQVGYKPVWTLQNEDELAGSATAAQRAFVGNEYRFLVMENRNARKQFEQPLEKVFLTNLASQAAAQTLMDRLVRLYGQEKRVYRQKVYDRMFQFVPGSKVNLIYSRSSIGSKQVTVQGISTNAGDQSTILEVRG